MVAITVTVVAAGHSGQYGGDGVRHGAHDVAGVMVTCAGQDEDVMDWLPAEDSEVKPEALQDVKVTCEGQELGDPESAGLVVV